jgi:hypothetical protein
MRDGTEGAAARRPATMLGDECEEFDQAALPWRAHAELEARQALSQRRRGARRIGAGSHER